MRWSVGSTTPGCRRRPAAGEWAIIEVVGHLADTEERALARVRRMLGEDNPSLEPFDQEALAEQRRYLDLDLEGELARLELLRRRHVAELEALDEPGWERSGRHGQHDTMSVELYETHVAAEEVDHLAQIASPRPTAVVTIAVDVVASLSRSIYIDPDGDHRDFLCHIARSWLGGGAGYAGGSSSCSPPSSSASLTWSRN